jgi:transcription antitermination factor NusG
MSNKPALLKVNAVVFFKKTRRNKKFIPKYVEIKMKDTNVAVRKVRETPPRKKLLSK